MHPIKVIITGGTIDAEAYPDPRHPPKYATMLSESPIPQALQALMEQGAPECVWVEFEKRSRSRGLRKDSQRFTVMDVARLAYFIHQQPEEDIVVSHGTDAMAENAKLLAQFLKQLGSTKRVTFTGAMIPLANGPQSDGYANLRFALEHVTEQASGVSIMMHGDVFPAGSVRKNREIMRFEPISGRQAA